MKFSNKVGSYDVKPLFVLYLDNPEHGIHVEEFYQLINNGNGKFSLVWNGDYR